MSRFEITVYVMYYLGIYNGTYCRLAAKDDTGKIIGRHAGNSFNMKLNDAAAISELLKRLLFEFNKMTTTRLEDCGGICIGGENISKKSPAFFLDIFCALGITCPIKAVYDGEMYIAAGMTNQIAPPEGAVVIAGESSRGYAVNKLGRTWECGGWGPVIDDGGSAYRIGLDAIRYSLLSYDGRLPETLLTDKVKKMLNIHFIREAVDIVNNSLNKRKIIELIMAVKNASNEGDFLAREIETKAARELYRIAEALICKLELTDSKVMMVGNSFLLDENIQNIFKELIISQFPRTDVFYLKEKPEMGGIHLAMC